MAGYAGTAYAEAPYAAPAAPSEVGPPEGRLSGTAPSVSGSFTVTATVQPVDGTLAGTAPGVIGSFEGGVPDAVTGSLAGQAPAVFGTFAGSYAAAPPAPVETSTQYANDGYNYDGTAAVYFEPPIAETPTHIRRVKVLQVHQSMSAPVLVNGRPT